MSVGAWHGSLPEHTDAQLLPIPPANQPEASFGPAEDVAREAVVVVAVVVAIIVVVYRCETNTQKAKP